MVTDTQQKVLDQIYKGAWKNLELTRSSKNTLIFAAVIIGLGIAGNVAINANSKPKSK